MRKIKRYSKIIISCISLICVLAVSALSTYARADEPYYEDTFQLLNHGNVRSSIMLGKNVQYTSGWFKTQNFTFNKDEPFYMVAYYTDAFKLTNQYVSGSDSYLYAQLGVMKSGLSGLTVEAGGILDIKFDWYYNIRVNEGIDSTIGEGGVDDLPITALNKDTRMIFSSNLSVDSNGTHQWFAIPGVEIKNHGIYNNVDSDRVSALYWSTVHFRFYNDTDQTLEFEMFEPHYDTVSGWKEPQYSDYVKSTFGGVYPTSKDVGAVYPSKSRPYVYMGYKANVLPSYKIVSAKGSGNFETEQSIQNATDSIVDELDNVKNSVDDVKDSVDDVKDSVDDVKDSVDDLGISIGKDLDDFETALDKDIKDATSAVTNKLQTEINGLETSIGNDLDDLEQSIGNDLSDLDTSINSGLDDLSSDISNEIGSDDYESDPDRYKEQTGTVDDATSDLDDAHSQEDKTVDEAMNNANAALKEYNVFDIDSVFSGISSLAKTVQVITPAFNGFVGSLGSEVGALLIYMFSGGVLISLLGVFAEAASRSVRSDRQRAARRKGGNSG